MGYFSEMSLAMEKSSFEEEESFDELPVPPVSYPTVQGEDETAFEHESDTSFVPEKVTEGPEEDNLAEKSAVSNSVNIKKTDTPAGNNVVKDIDEEKRRAEHEAAEAKRKAEWEAKQAEKKQVLQEQIDRLAAMSDDEVVSASMQRVSKDVEKLTRRNMKECVSEYIQTLCLSDPAFARLTMYPKKTMIHCFQYISRKAWDYVQDELKASGIQPGQGSQGYGCDIPDDLCYQGADDYFRDSDAKEDQ